MDYAQARIVQKYGKSIESKLPLAVPIVLEVGSDLADVFQGDLPENMNPIAKQAFIKMREDLEKQFGVRIPGVRIRKNERWRVEYAIQIHECVIEQGELHREGNAPLVNMTEKLQQVIKKSLGEFIGVAETAGLLSGEQKESPSCREILEDLVNLGQFTQVLRRLVWEQVPIVQLNPIAVEFLRAQKSKMNVVEITENVRALPKIRNTLLGNNPNSDFIETAPELESRFQKCIVRLANMPRLNFNIAHIRYISQIIRDAIAEVPNSVIVVKDPTIRPYFRDFLDAEYPQVPVLAWRELLPEYHAQIHRKIKWGG